MLSTELLLVAVVSMAEALSCVAFVPTRKLCASDVILDVKLQSHRALLSLAPLRCSIFWLHSHISVQQEYLLMLDIAYLFVASVACVPVMSSALWSVQRS